MKYMVWFLNIRKQVGLINMTSPSSFLFLLHTLSCFLPFFAASPVPVQPFCSFSRKYQYSASLHKDLSCLFPRSLFLSAVFFHWPCTSLLFLGIFIYRVLFQPSRMPWACILLKTSDFESGLSRSHFLDNKMCVFAYACLIMSHFIWNFIKILLSFGLLTKYWPFSIFHTISPIPNFRFRQYIWCFIFSALVLHLNFLRLLSASCTVHKRFLQLNGFFLLMHIKHGCS